MRKIIGEFSCWKACIQFNYIMHQILPLNYHYNITLKISLKYQYFIYILISATIHSIQPLQKSFNQSILQFSQSLLFKIAQRHRTVDYFELNYIIHLNSKKKGVQKFDNFYIKWIKEQFVLLFLIYGTLKNMLVYFLCFYCKSILQLIILHQGMSESKILITSILAVLLTAGTLFYMAPDSDLNSLTKDDSLKCVSRSSIISRGQSWVDQHVPYNQGTKDGYRTDCSGYVSMCWQLPTPGHTTSTLPSVTATISKGELQPGDAILCPGTHVILFAGWATGNTHYTGMQESNPSTGCIKRVTPYPYWDNVSCYHPVRYNNVC